MLVAQVDAGIGKIQRTHGIHEIKHISLSVLLPLLRVHVFLLSSHWNAAGTGVPIYRSTVLLPTWELSSSNEASLSPNVGEGSPVLDVEHGW